MLNLRINFLKKQGISKFFNNFILLNSFFLYNLAPY